jgi:3-oxoacyl-[acyl-carrier-protein] synthase-3
MPNAHITGWGAYVPELVVTNEDLAQIVPTSDDWIRDRTGIGERRIASGDEHTSTMGIQAGRRALQVANLDPGKLDLVICATSTPDYLMPATACLIQDGLGATHAAAFDLNTACSGFVYALSVGASMVRAGAYSNVLVVGSEVMSRVLNWTDRSTCVLFGDGAGAVVLEASEEPGGVLSFSLGSDGSGGDLLNVKLGTRNLPSTEMLASGTGFMHMNGPEVFRFASRIMNQATRKVVEDAGLTLEDVDLLIPHQANTRILQVAAKQLGIPEDRIFSNLEHFGNTSAASVPIALVDALEAGRIASGDHIVFVGFGGGLTWGACLVEWAYGPEGRDWPVWRRGLLGLRVQLAGAKRLISRTERRLEALDDRLRKHEFPGWNGPSDRGGPPPGENGG